MPYLFLKVWKERFNWEEYKQLLINTIKNIKNKMNSLV